MNHHPDDDRVAELARWLIAEARLSLAPLELIDRFCRQLVEFGVPLWRLRAGQQLANPLASAWGIIWTRDGSDTHEYVVSRATLSTGAYHGSPFQHVVERRQSFRRRLLDLRERDHQVLHEMAAAGGTDYLAVPLEYGDGSVQGLSLVSDGKDGFAESHVELIERLRQPLAAALEPTAMRRSSASLLRTFLGDGPADAVLAGAIKRGDRRHIDAAILFSDLRGFTAMSEHLGEADLFAALDRYFEAVVEAVRGGGGDVLKFLGDGVLAIFPVEAAGSRAAACGAALRAVDHARERLVGATAADGTSLAFTATLHVGQVVYGNIGSPDRLDFTVLGRAVNLVSRLEGLAKEMARPLLCSAAFAAALDAPLASLSVSFGAATANR
jgi:adenylate cyclase